MIKVLFICHGNICRSTMAEYVMKDLVKKANLESSFYIDSAGTSNEEDGNPLLVEEETIPRVIVVEGEKDTLVLAEAGYRYVISVPDRKSTRLNSSHRT